MKEKLVREPRNESSFVVVDFASNRLNVNLPVQSTRRHSTPKWLFGGRFVCRFDFNDRAFLRDLRNFDYNLLALFEIDHERFNCVFSLTWRRRRGSTKSCRS